MASSEQRSYLTRKTHPAKLALLVSLFMVLVMLVIKFTMDQESESTKLLYWEIALVATLVYALFSCVFSLLSDKKLKYFALSIVSYLVIVILGIFMAGNFSGLSISEAGSFEWLFKLFSFSFLLLISVFNLMSKVMEIVKRQDEEIRRQQNNKTS